MKRTGLALFHIAFVVVLSSCGGSGGGGGTQPPLISSVSGVTVSPASATLSANETRQFTATVAGTGNFTTGVTWSVSPTVGTISATGLYTAPAMPTGTVTVTATSTFDSSKKGTAAVGFSVQPAPALMVDAAARTHAISPLIYGMNFYTDAANAAAAKSINLPVNRWGGNATTRYNFKDDITNIGFDWFFETLPNSNTDYPNTSEFNTQHLNDKSVGALTIGTIPMTGWVGKRQRGCSFSVAKYGAQQKTDRYFTDCGNGLKPDGTQITGNDPNDANIPINNVTWASDWVTFLTGKFGSAASGGVAIYSLDNEPTWWDGNHRDVHPKPFTYDEVTDGGTAVAKAIKAADPTAAVSGPVIDFWPAYFYSMLDIRSGWWNTNPIDRNAHGGKPFLEYYLSKFHDAEIADGVRYLDYLDLHTYFAANDLNFAPAADQATELVRINSTRALWDPTYIAPGHQFTDPNDTSGTKDVAPMIIPRMKQWITDSYPGTKTAITEYNWGAQESISGAVAQADVLGIFGREGLDLATLWGPPDPVKQVPGLLAFKIFRNYDNANGQFGDTSIVSTSTDHTKLAVYGATRASDHALTVMVINKTFGDLQGDLALANFTATGAARVYRYSNADLNNIQHLADATVTLPTGGSTTSTIKSQTFPAMSITLYVVN